MKLFGAIQEYDPATFKAMLNGDTEGPQYLAQYMEKFKKQWIQKQLVSWSKH